MSPWAYGLQIKLELSWGGELSCIYADPNPKSSPDGQTGLTTQSGTSLVPGLTPPNLWVWPLRP